MMLECPGVFLAPFVPEGWTASGEPGSFYQLEPPTQDAAIQISVYAKRDPGIGESAARDLLATFLTKAVGTTGGEIRVLDERPGQQRAFSRFTHPLDDGTPQHWFTACIVWPEHMLMCSYVGGERDLEAAEAMLASIVRPDPAADLG